MMKQGSYHAVVWYQLLPLPLKTALEASGVGNGTRMLRRQQRQQQLAWQLLFRAGYMTAVWVSSTAERHAALVGGLEVAQGISATLNWSYRPCSPSSCPL